MGDLRPWSPEPNGAVSEERPSLASLSSVVSSNRTAVGAEYWEKAEAAAQGIIAQVQPTLLSEDRRKAVIDYVQRLIRNSIGCEVFPFGSVPLKTYLPDGDIDLTAFGGVNNEEALASDVYSVLDMEDQNTSAEFIVKDVQLIRAEVKLVKCLVQNIVVDISFNQLGGLCTLCFLEKVDRLIGKDHLFKRSIILIKAWCYYESRILGAHHGLISTYALETLVLYIFHFFHSTLNGPLAVLYKFLEYFSKFDWDNYCVSLNGPIRISSMPEVVVEMPENGGYDLLLTNDFLKDCVEMFSVPSRGLDANSRAFSPKHLNIVDPLKENNNLGRSVSKGNFFRIRSAFSYGARKLGRILSHPEENVADELGKFFSNTLDRHGSGQRPDVQDTIYMDGKLGHGAPLPFSGQESFQEGQTISESETADLSGISGEFRLDNEQLPHGGVDLNVFGKEMSLSTTTDEPQTYANGSSVSENRLSGDATSRIQGLSISNDIPKYSAPSVEGNLSPMGKARRAPHLYFSHSAMVNGEIRNEILERKQPENSSLTEKSVSFGILPAPGEETASVASTDLDDSQSRTKLQVWSSVGSTYHPSLLSSMTWSSEDIYSGHSGDQSSTPGALNTLSDLSGDYESHLNSLHHGHCCYAFASNAPGLPMSPPLLSQFQDKSSWDLVRRSPHLRQNVSQLNFNGVMPRTVFYPMNPPLLPGAAFGMEEMPKPRGTGTYFPNANHYRDRPFVARGRNQAPVRSPRNNGRNGTFQDSNMLERNNRELSQTQSHAHQGGGRSGSSDLHHSAYAETKPYSNVNGSIHLPENVVEFGSIGHLPVGPSIETGRKPHPGSAPAQNSSISLSLSGMRRQNVLVTDTDRIDARSYQLKDEDDFPPLSDSSGKGLPMNVVRKLEKEQ